MQNFCTPFISHSTPYHSDIRAVVPGFVGSKEISCTVRGGEAETAVRAGLKRSIPHRFQAICGRHSNERTAMATVAPPAVQRHTHRIRGNPTMKNQRTIETKTPDIPAEQGEREQAGPAHSVDEFRTRR